MDEELAPIAAPWPPAWRWAARIGPACLVLLLGFLPVPDQTNARDSVVVLVVVACAAIATAVREWWPHLVLGGAVAGLILLAATGDFSAGVVAALAATTHASATHASRRGAVWITVLLATSVFVVLGWSGLVHDVDMHAFPVAVVVALAGAMGDAARSRRDYVSAVEDRARRAEETRDAEARRRVIEERLRIARDLHDAVAHQIAVISLNAGVATSALESQPDKARHALATVRSASREVLKEIGGLLAALRADGDDEAARGSGSETVRTPAPQRGLAAIPELVDHYRALGMTIDAEITGDISVLPLATDLAAYQVLREALTNAHKHGDGTRARVRIDAGAEDAVIVVTNLMPAHPRASEASTGYGLVGLRERVASVRGTVVNTVVPGGYRLTATLPLGGDG